MPTTRTCFVILLVRQDHGYIEWGAVTNCRPDASYEDGDVVFFFCCVSLDFVGYMVTHTPATNLKYV
jgi:hypothetical protein